MPAPRISRGGALPFGYRRGQYGKLQKVPEQQEAIKTIKHLHHVKKRSLREISQHLHAVEGIELSHMGVADVLRREQAKASGKKGTR